MGLLWYDLCDRQAFYWARYVESSLNLADGPSRGVLDLMKALSAKELVVPFPAVGKALDVFELPVAPWRLVV